MFFDQYIQKRAIIDLTSAPFLLLHLTTCFASGLSLILLTLPLGFTTLLLNPKFTGASLCEWAQCSDKPQLRYAAGLGCRQYEETVSLVCDIQTNTLYWPQAKPYFNIPLLPTSVPTHPPSSLPALNSPTHTVNILSNMSTSTSNLCLLTDSKGDISIFGLSSN